MYLYCDSIVEQDNVQWLLLDSTQSLGEDEESRVIMANKVVRVFCSMESGWCAPIHLHSQQSVESEMHDVDRIHIQILYVELSILHREGEFDKVVSHHEKLVGPPWQAIPFPRDIAATL